jgi:hypothetical protein
MSVSNKLWYESLRYASPGLAADLARHDHPHPHKPPGRDAARFGQGAMQNGQDWNDSPWWWNVWRVASTAGGVLGTYHGYKRTDSVGWALGWGFLGALFPYITVPIAVAQGFGEKEKK